MREWQARQLAKQIAEMVEVTLEATVGATYRVPKVTDSQVKKLTEVLVRASE